MDKSAPAQIDFSHRLPTPLQYTAFNQEQAIQIDRLHGIRTISMSASGVFTTATNTATALTEPKFIDQVRLTVGGGTVLWSGDFQALYRINQFEYGVTPPFSNGVNGAAAAGKTWTAVAMIDLQSVMGRAPVDTVLISRLFSSIELRASILDITAAASGLVAADGTFTSFSIDVTLDEVVNLKDGFGKFVKKISFIERVVTATQTEFVMPLPTGNLIKDIYVRSFTNGAPVTNIINNIKVMVGGEVVYDEKVANILAAQLLRNQLNTQISGYYHVSLQPDRLLSEGLNLSKVAALGCNLILDVTNQTGTNLVRAVTKELLPIG